VQFERAHSTLASQPFPVERFILFESHLSRHGPHYDQMAEFKLAR
jgi:2'-5' RNA ligase